MKNQNRPLRRLIYAALFAALCCVVTYIIIIPLPHGYVNAGDIMVLLAAFCMGPWYGGAAAALGSALADLLAGYALYAPATALIKFAVPMVAIWSYRALKRVFSKSVTDVLCRTIACILGECVMVLGYFLYETVLYDAAGAWISVPGNALQGLCCALGAVLVTQTLRIIKPLHREFPDLAQ